MSSPLRLAGAGSVWRLQASPRELARGLEACALPANALVVTEATWMNMVPDGAYVECPTFFLEDKVGFVALLAYFAMNGHSFRLFVRSPAGEADGLLLAYPRLDEATLEMLRRFDRLAAEQIDHLCDRLEAMLGTIGHLPSA